MVNGFPRKPAVKLAAQELLQFFARKLPKLRVAESRNEMHVKHVPVVLLGCAFECRQDHRHPVLFDKFSKCPDRLWSSLTAVDGTQPLRHYLHGLSARWEFCDAADHFRPSQPPERAVLLNYVLPPARYPDFPPSAPLEK